MVSPHAGLNRPSLIQLSLSFSSKELYDIDLGIEQDECGRQHIYTLAASPDGTVSLNIPVAF
jgi:hypothetical protein